MVKKKRSKKKKTQNKWMKLIYIFFLCAFLPITMMLKNWAVKNPGWVEEIYAQKWYKTLSQPWSRFFSAVGFSVIEFFIYTLIISLITALILVSYKSL